GLFAYVRKKCPIFLIDPKDVKTQRADIHFIKATASEGVKQLTEFLMQIK
ncbi:MAG: NAD-dependent deacylase, partial [Massilibacteroides sp.]|nr:NAD-dependent deacylase [Massilibacteroides sp.]